MICSSKWNDQTYYKWFYQYQLLYLETLYCGLKYQVIHLNLMTNVGLLGVLDMHHTWLHIQKLCHQVNIISIYQMAMWFWLLGHSPYESYHPHPLIPIVFPSLIPHDKFCVVTDNENVLNCVIIQASLLLCGSVLTTTASTVTSLFL